MAANKKHVFIFKVPRHIKLEFNQLSNLLYTNFYDPYSRQILYDWLMWAEDTFSHEQDFYQTFLFLNDTSVLKELLDWLIKSMVDDIQSGSGDEYCYAVYIQESNLNSRILNKVKELMKSKGFY